MDDTIDILGSPHRSLSLWQSLPILIRSTLYTSGLIALYFGSIRAWAFLKIHREVNYRRAMRRKHGIPDDDRRPFNVAYAAVVRERQQPEWYRILGETLARLPIAPPPPPAIESLDAWSTGVAGNSTSAHAQPPADDPLNFAERYNPHRNQIANATTRPRSPTPPTNLKRRKVLRFVSPLVTRTYKRAYSSGGSDVEEDDEGFTKRFRVEDEPSSDPGEHSDAPPGSRKRMMEGDGRGKDKGKRQRQSDDDEMSDDDDGDDDVTELFSIPSTRGKKRDRAEAGSTVGLDDEETEGKTSRRKRRTMSKRKSDSFEAQNVRGLKRDRESESIESGSEDDGEVRTKQEKRRGKKTKPSVLLDNQMDLAADDSFFADDSAQPRRIGEIWTANGVRYRISTDGRLQRQALVRQPRAQFSSGTTEAGHAANQDVFLECWLTEREYKDARDRNELAWQDTPPSSRSSSVEPETLDDPDSPSRTRAQSSPDNLPRPGSAPGTGKALLWSSTTQNTPSPPRTPLHSLPNSALRASSVQHRLSHTWLPQVNTGITIDPDSPKKEVFRAYSKWERQDMEAEAMRKMREKLEEEKKAKNAAAAAASAAAKSAAIAPGGEGVAAPAISLTAPVGPSMLGEPPKNAPAITVTSPSSTAPTARPAAAKPAATPPGPSPFTPPAQSSSQSAATPATQPPPAFTFAKPTASATQSPAPSAQPAQTSTIPNFFAVPASATTPATPATTTASAAAGPSTWPSTNTKPSTSPWVPPSTTPSSSDVKPSPFGVMPQTNQTEKAALFNFAAPTKPSVSPFGVPTTNATTTTASPSFFGQPPKSQQQPSATDGSMLGAPPITTTAAAPSTSAPAPPTNAPAPSLFSLKPSSWEPKKQEESSTGGSLLSRMGGFAQPAASGSTLGQSPSTSVPPFTFAAPAPQGPMTSVPSLPTSNATMPSQAGQSAPKFSFGMSKSGTSTTPVAFGDPSKPSATSEINGVGQMNGTGTASSTGLAKFTFGSSAPPPFIFGAGVKPTTQSQPSTSFAAFGGSNADPFSAGTAMMTTPTPTMDDGGGGTNGADSQPKTNFTFKFAAPTSTGGSYPSFGGNTQSSGMMNGFQFGAK